jgi:hypothetical protein
MGDREGGATAIFEKSGPPDSADPADFCNKIRQQPTYDSASPCPLRGNRQDRQ